MNYYADTSWWFAYKYRRDLHHEAAIRLFDHDTDAVVIWTPWQRVEVFNIVRQAERAGLLSEGESHLVISEIEREILLGYWPHKEFKWTEAVRTACKLSATLGMNFPIRGMDLFHAAVAIEVRADAFLTFDIEQADLMRAAGMKVPALKRRGRR